MANDQYTLYAVEVTGSLIDQVASRDADPGIEELLETVDGKVDPEFTAVISQSPRFTFSTTALAKALAVIALDGLDMASSETALYWQKMQDGGTRATGASHLKIALSDGMIVPRSIRATQGDGATIEYEAFGVSSDGTTNPLVVTTGVSLPGTPADDERFTVGPAVINGTTLNGVQEITVDFGIEERIRNADGFAYPTFVGIARRQPSITIRTDNIAAADTVGAAGDTIASATRVFFQKLDPFGVRSATGHYSVTVAEGRVSVRSVGEMAEITIRPTYDDSNDILALSTSVALP